MRTNAYVFICFFHQCLLHTRDCALFKRQVVPGFTSLISLPTRSVFECAVSCADTKDHDYIYEYKDMICNIGQTTSVKSTQHSVWILVLEKPETPQLLVSGLSNSTDLQLMDLETFASTSIPGSAGYVYSMVWNTNQNKIFASYWPPSLLSFAVDGSQKKEISKVFSTDMALDEGRQRLFYADSQQRTISSMNTDGSNVKVILQNLGALAIGLDVENSVIYYLKEDYYQEYTEDKIFTVKYDGSGERRLGNMNTRTRAMFVSREEKRWYIAANMEIHYKEMKYKFAPGITGSENYPFTDDSSGHTMDDILVYAGKLYCVRRLKEKGKEIARIEKYNSTAQRVGSIPLPVPSGSDKRRYLLEMVH